MARIRSLKPQFFKNEDLCALSPWHRLCFQGLWCHADREGRLEDRPRRLKVEIFPYDDVDMDDLLCGLTDAGFIARYVVNGIKTIWIPTFAQHQVPKKDEHESNLPAYNGLDGPQLHRISTAVVPQRNSDGPVVVQRVGHKDIRTLGHEEGGNGTNVPTVSPSDLVAIWNSNRGELAEVVKLTTDRGRRAKARLQERPDLGWWVSVAQRIAASAFCCGKNDRGWRADFDFFVRPGSAEKTMEGKYDERKRSVAFSASELKQAAEFRKRAWGACRHDPDCGDYDLCVSLIAADQRLKVSA